MRWIFNFAHLLFFVIIFVQSDPNPYNNQPRIIVEDGNLVFQTAVYNNITFRSYGSGKIRINNEDLEELVKKAQSSITAMERFKAIDASTISNQLSLLKTRVDELDEMMTNFRELSDKVNNITLQVNRLYGDGRRTWTLTRLTRKALNRDDCASNPCRNGGTCTDNYNGFNCQCPDNWQGLVCDQDVDECGLYRNTEMGCQNGATCSNKPGGYDCFCPPNKHGVRCNLDHDACNAPSLDSRGLCLYGVCINQPKNQRRFTCICQEGWQENNLTGVCDQDIDECQRARCSVNPLVTCINTMGSFHCGHCPRGYDGDGVRCHDINECNINNGGCSVHPRVECINELGSYRCAPCPPGYHGDGRNCLPGVCSVRNGDCHPLATCIENNAVYAGYRECRCPSGYLGNGIGPNGCSAQHSGQVGTACDSSPCVHGSCRPHLNTFLCVCYAGYNGPLCDRPVSACSSNPCRNGGTCADRPEGFSCNCPSTFHGTTCEQEAQSCGERLNDESGRIRYPLNAGEQYPHNIDCPWVIYTQPGKVLNLTFVFLQLERSHDCSIDYLQINDGDSPSSPLIQKYCYGTNTPNVISTHNYLYILFHSDATVNDDGFEISWNTTDPVCGGMKTASHGTVSSPGYPVVYPHNRDCYWYLQVPPGKRILLQFSQMAIEIHINCSFDFVRVYDGANDRSPELDTYCSSTTPEPLTTSGSNAVVYFHSDSSMSDKGFNLVYTAVPGIPGCGGVLTSDKGVFVSPNYPNRYFNHMNCEWLIRVHPDERIKLTFEEFHLEGGDSRCVFDYLEIRNGGDENSPLISRHCGRNIPPPITSTTNKLWIKFASDQSIMRDGFKAKYETTCGGFYTSPTGIIKSPNYPDSYPSSRTCSYHIQIPVGKLVHLQFLDFDIEDDDCQFDSLEAFDNGSPNGTSLAHVCGTSLPDPITSTYNHLLVVFRTDSSVENKGFLANYSGIDIGCGGVLTDPNGYFTTPNHPENYPHGAVCNWLIRGPEGYVVELEFNFFELESDTNCTYDYVEILDSDYHSLGRYCGTQKPPRLTSTDKEIYVKLKTDETISRLGFSANFHILDYSRHCGGNFKREYGVITSPGYPNHYPHNKDCTWTVEAPSGKQIRLQINNFTLESHSNCRFDSLEIRNGLYSTSPLIGKFCGTIILNPIISQHHQLYLRFKTDSSSTETGFQIVYDSASTGCGGVLTSETGAIQSPSYPQPYGHNAECEWTIRVAQGSKISVVLVDLDVEPNSACEYDYLRIFDGESDAAPPLTEKLCNTRQNPGTITSTKNVMHIIFQTDASVNGRGFSLAYHANCNNVLKGIRGVIESPNFPNFYPHNYNCTWEIQAPEGNNISIAFSTLTLENDTDCDYDRIEILKPVAVTRTGASAALQSIRRFCGTPTPLPRPIMINASKVFVRFISDSSTAMDGFRLEYAVRGCVGEYRKSYGTIQSPNYPNGYLPKLKCEWHIITQPGSTVRLYVDEMDIEGSQECFFDTLFVYDGLDDKSTQLHKFCHKLSQPMTLASTSNRMMLRFNTDYTIQGKGFRLHYYEQSDCNLYYRNVNQGTITSKNYPNNYGNGTVCTYNIIVPENHLVEIDFVDFDLPEDPGCQNNYIEVKDGEHWYDDGPVLFRHCGSQLPENYTHIVSSANKVYLKMFTSGSETGRGFKANFKSGCGSRIEVKSTSVLKSPNYPHGSVHHNNCSWILIAPEGEHVTLTFNVMVIMNTENCSTAYVDIRDGYSQDNPLIGRHCGHAVPPPITSRGNHLYVFLQNFGLFKATYTNSASVCGAEFTSPEGSFNSPAYPADYPQSSECIWTINSAPGNLIQLTFYLFEMEDNENCNTDYLEIHERGPDGRSLGRYCGTNMPTNISAVNSLWLKFRTDGYGSSTGFQATYATLHGIPLSGNVGQVASPMYPLKNYISGTYKWTITVDPSLFVSVRFLDFEVSESNYDHCDTYVEIFDGTGDQAVSLGGELCGADKPDPVIASTNVVTITYKTMGYRRARWLISWEGVNSSFIATAAPPTDSPGSACGQEVFLNHTSNTTVVTTPNFPNGYPRNINCTWLFLTVPGRSVSFKLNASVDGISYRSSRARECGGKINFYDAISPGSQWVPTPQGEICGRETNLTITSSFVSGARVRKMTFNSGRYAYYNRYYYGISLQAYDECGGVLTESNGVITSANGFRRNGTEPCVWLIQVRRGRTIKITFERFNILSTVTSCSPFYIQLRNGGYSDSPHLGAAKYCGDNLPSIPESSSNKVYVSFKGPVTGEHSVDFVLRYEEISLGCGGQIRLTHENPRAKITSPNHPLDPPHDVECDWVVMSPLGTRIRLDLDSLFIESGKCNVIDSGNSSMRNYLEAYDGGTLNAHQLKRYCSHQYQSSIRATGNTMLVRFVSSEDVAHAHFNATVTIARCGGILSHAYQVQSPNYPNNYNNNEDCEWIVDSGSGRVAVVGTFMDLSLPYNTNCSNTDHVEIRGESSTGPLIGRFCGLINGTNLTSFSEDYSRIYIKFRSDANETMKGFRLRMTYRTMCWESLNADSGSISSPGFPAPYPFARTCYWYIYVQEGKRISLTFSDFHLPIDPATGICSQYIKVVRGSLFQNTTNVPLCGTTIPTIESSYNTITLFLKTTSGLSQGQGFRATYTSDIDPIEDIFPLSSTRSVFKQSLKAMKVGVRVYSPFSPLTRNTCYDFLRVVGKTRKPCHPSQLCGETLTEPSGFIVSPNLQPRRAYIETMDCRNKIVLPNYATNSTLAFRVLDFYNGNDLSCNISALFIGSYNNRDQVHQICSMPSSEILLYGANAGIVSYTRSFGEIRYNISYELHECGGFLTAPATVLSPGYPNNYPNNSRCIWYIMTHSDQLQITTTEAPRLGGNCLNSNMTIKNGYSPTSPVVAFFCNGQSSLLNVTTMGRVAQVILFSDGSVSDRGFNISFDIVDRGCGGLFQQTRGRLRSPNYPRLYPNNTQCEWTIRLNPTYRVNISFEGRFDIENTTGCANDYLLIEELRADNVDTDRTWHPIQRLCGHQTPNLTIIESNEVRITFTSNERVEGDGFLLNYLGACGGRHNDPSGIINSPGFPREYDHDIECYYHIGNSPNDYVTLQFDTESFDVELHPECQYDSVSIYMGNSTNSPPLDVFCNRPEENRVRLFVVQGPVLIVFKTDDSVNKRGFSFNYNLSSCGGQLSGPGGIIKSPFYPHPYLHKMKCVWNIEVAEKRVVEFRIFDLVLEGYESNCHDYVALNEGNSSGQLLGKFCDRDKPKVIRSIGNRLAVTFRSDYSVAGKGFRAVYRETFGQEDGCGGVIRAISGDIVSLDYDKNGQYEIGLDCVWRIVGQELKVLRIVFEKFDVEEGISFNETDRCPADYLEIRDGITGYSPVIGKYCGTTIPYEIVVSSNQIFIHFHSDMSETTAKGFKMSFSSQNPICGGLLNVTHDLQTLNSPNYPATYPPNLRCRWEFVFNSSLVERIEATITDFDVPCGDAYLDVFIGRKPEEHYQQPQPHHFRYCDQNYFQVTYASQSFVLIFNTGRRLSKRGFSLAYKKSNCSRHYTEDNGYIHSPPNDAESVALNCQISITAKPGRTISLYFMQFWNSRRANCENQYLRIYDGTNSSASQLYENCGGSSRPLPIFSTGENVLLHYFNNEQTAFSKYMIAYTTTDKGPGCGGSLRGPSGAFASPFYPAAMNQSKSCLWNLYVLQQHTMNIVVEDFILSSDLGCETNYLEIYNGNVETEAGKIGRYCGNDNVRIIRSQGNEILVKLVTNTNNTERGFRIHFEMNTEELQIPFTIEMDTAMPSVAPTRGSELDSDDLE